MKEEWKVRLIDAMAKAMAAKCNRSHDWPFWVEEAQAALSAIDDAGFAVVLANKYTLDELLAPMVTPLTGAMPEWREVTQEQIKAIDDLVAPEFATGKWEFVEMEGQSYADRADSATTFDPEEQFDRDNP